MCNLDFDYVVGDGLYYNVQVGADAVRKKCSAEIIYIGSITPYDCTIDVKPFCAAYASLTVDNFLLNLTGGACYRADGYLGDKYGYNFSNTITKSYNKATGTLKIVGLGYNHPSGNLVRWTVSGFIYLVV